MTVQPDILDRPPPAPDHTIAYLNGPHRFGHLRLPEGDGPHPMVVVLHGGFWRAAYDLAHIGHLCEALRGEGLATWSLEYRRIGHEGGGFPGTCDDVVAGAAYLRVLAASFPIDLARVVVLGHSAGGHLALWLARHRPLPLRGVVALAPVADLRRAHELNLSNGAAAAFVGGLPEAEPRRWHHASPVELVPLGLPQRLVHGENDVDVPLEISLRYADAAQRAGDDCTLTILPRTGHFEPIDPRSAAWGEVRDAVVRLI